MLEHALAEDAVVAVVVELEAGDVAAAEPEGQRGVTCATAGLGDHGSTGVDAHDGSSGSNRPGQSASNVTCVTTGVDEAQPWAGACDADGGGAETSDRRSRGLFIQGRDQAG